MAEPCSSLNSTITNSDRCTSRSRSRGKGLGSVFRRSHSRSRSSSTGRRHIVEPARSRSRSGTRAVSSTSTAPKKVTGLKAGVDPAAVTSKVRDLVGADIDRLPVLVGLVCARLAAQKSFFREEIRDELLPHLPNDVSGFEVFLDWVMEEGEAISRPRDPRIVDQGRPLRDGDHVLIQGLSKRPDLNGRRAVVIRATDPSQPGRCILRLQDQESGQLAIRPENLRPLIASPNLTVRSPPMTPSQPPAAETASRKDTAAADGPLPPTAQPSVFSANLAKLRAKAEAEEQGTLPKKKDPDKDKRGGIGSANPAGAARRELIFGTGGGPLGQRNVEEAPAPKLEPVSFVRAEESTQMPSRKIVVIDPRRPKTATDNSDEEQFEAGTPGFIQPRPVTFDRRKGDRIRVKRQTSPLPARDGEGLAASSQPPSSPLPGNKPAMQAVSSPLPNASTPAIPSSPASLCAKGSKHLKLVVSETAREEDKVVQEIQEKKNQLESGRKNMLAQLTKQLQLCLARVQSGDLDDRSKEKYQDMISSLKAQMAKISNF